MTNLAEVNIDKSATENVSKNTENTPFKGCFAGKTARLLRTAAAFSPRFGSARLGAS
jgi:hypothetical protein